MNAIVQKMLITKYGNGKYFVVTSTTSDHYRVEIWNEEKTRILFLLEGEL